MAVLRSLSSAMYSGPFFTLVVKKKKETKKKGDRAENYAYSVRIFCGGNTRCEINVLKIQLRDGVLCN